MNYEDVTSVHHIIHKALGVGRRRGEREEDTDRSCLRY